MVTTTYDDIRSALDVTQSEVPDSELTFEKEFAEAIVSDDLSPHSDNDSRLELTAAYLAAAAYRSEGTVTQLSQGSRQLSFTSDGALGLWRKAQMADPTGRLGQTHKPSGSVGVPDLK